MNHSIIRGTSGDYQQEIGRLRQAFYDADAVLVGAGAGLSTAAGLAYDGQRLETYFGDFVEKYGMPDMYHGCFAPFASRGERWAYWSRWSWVNRYMDIPKDTLQKLRTLLERKDDWFVLTTNIDHSFRRTGFAKEKTFYTQGDLGLFQCSRPCCEDTCDNKDQVRAMMEAQGFVIDPTGRASLPEDRALSMTIPPDLIPHCDRCGAEMDFNLFWDDRFVRDEGWYQANGRYRAWKEAHISGRVLYLELGVGYNSPGVIKFPFWQMTAQNSRATFASINLGAPSTHRDIWAQSIVISRDIDRVIQDLL